MKTSLSDNPIVPTRRRQALRRYIFAFENDRQAPKTDPLRPGKDLEEASLIFEADALVNAIDLIDHLRIAGPARKKIDALIGGEILDVANPNLPEAEALNKEFFRLAAEYESATAKLSPNGRPPRDAADVIAWIDGSKTAVFPKLREGYDVLTDGQRKVADIFFYTTVFFDIAREELEETLWAANRREAEAYVRELANRRILKNEEFDLETDAGFLNLKDEAEKDYARMLDHSISLLDRSVKALCDMENVDENHRQQLNQIQAAMDLDRKNLLVMMDFGREFDAFIRGERETLRGFFNSPGGGELTELRRLPTPQEFNNAAQLNIFLRYMQLGYFKMVWRNLPEKKRQNFDFDKCLSQMISMGAKVDANGNRSNDVGTFWKEALEGTMVNSIIVEALNDPDPERKASPEELLASHKALMAMEEHSARQLIGKVLELYLSGEYDRRSIRLKEEYPNSPTLALMDKVLREGGPFDRVINSWNEEHHSLQRPDLISEVGKLYDVKALFEAQLLVLLRYVASAKHKMQI